MVKAKKKVEGGGNEIFRLRINFPTFEAFAGKKRSLSIREYTIQRPGELTKKMLSHFVKSGSTVHMDGLLRHRGSAVVEVGEARDEMYDGSIMSVKRVIPFKALTSYEFHGPNGEKAPQEFLVVWEREHKLPPGMAVPEEKRLKYVQNFLEKLRDDGNAVLPEIKSVADMRTLLKKLKRTKGCRIEKSILNLREINNHEELFKAVQRYKMLQFHKGELQEESKFSTLHRLGSVKGRFRKATRSEKKLLRKLGIKPTKYVFEISEKPKENKDTSPESLLAFVKTASKTKLRVKPLVKPLPDLSP